MVEAKPPCREQAGGEVAQENRDAVHNMSANVLCQDEGRRLISLLRG